MRRFLPILVLALITISTGALAQETDDPPERALLLILDASGSMDRVDADGVRLIDGAKQALLDLLDSLPDDVLVGLRVYGHRHPNDDRAIGCTDTELVVPIGPLDRVAMGDAIESFDAKGFTPIGLSLSEAAGDFPPDAGTKAIVLVSDGEDTCAPPDPCDVARGLFAEGVFVRIETVGLVLDDAAARDQLQCIADATGGMYHDIGTIDILVNQLGGIAEAAIEGPQGLLLGGLTRAQATELHTCCPGTLPPPDGDGTFVVESGHYRIPIRQGQTLWFSLALQDLQAAELSASLAVLEGVVPEGYLELNVLDEAGAEVAGDRDAFGPRRSLISEQPKVWATMLDVSEFTGDLGPPPMWPGTYYVTITWDAPPEDIAGEIELSVETHEASGSYTGFIRESRGAPLGSMFESLPGGPSREAATAVPTLTVTGLPGPYAAEDSFWIQIHPGEVLWYSIDLLDLQAASVSINGLEVPGIGTPPGEIDLRIYDEEGQEVAGERLAVTSRIPPQATMMEPPGGGNPQLWPGRYSIRVWWDSADDGMVVEALLSVLVTQIEGQEGIHIQQERQAGTDAEVTSTAVEQETAPTRPEATDGIPGPDTVEEEPEDGGESGPLLPILLGAAVVLLAGGGAWLVRRRRQ